MLVAICSNSSSPATWRLKPARARPARIPETMAAEEDPRPFAKGMRFFVQYRRMGVSLPMALNAASTPLHTKLPWDLGSMAAPSPSMSNENCVARSTVTSRAIEMHARL